MLKLENIHKTFHAGTVNQKIALDSVGDACHEYDEKRNVNDQQALQERFFVLHV